MAVNCSNTCAAVLNARIWLDMPVLLAWPILSAAAISTVLIPMVILRAMPMGVMSWAMSPIPTPGLCPPLRRGVRMWIILAIMNTAWLKKHGPVSFMWGPMTACCMRSMRAMAANYSPMCLPLCKPISMNLPAPVMHTSILSMARLLPRKWIGEVIPAGGLF